MVFSSLTFIYYFLPILFILYFIVPYKFKSYVLVLMSFIFYFYGEGKYLALLILSAVFNYYVSKKITNNKKLLIFSLIVNFVPIIYFKYSNFFLQNVNGILNTNFFINGLVLPIGISFFTFQNVSYIIDVYKDKKEKASSLLNYVLYLTFFAQLVAGPIVRYSEIKNDVDKRKLNFINLYNGFIRFVYGLSKKVLLANGIGILIDNLNTLSDKSVLLYWILALSYTLQIYFDFSGYSDMAIGIGKMFNFNFLENFNYPLSSKSITEFWRRWHISLSRWFRDYVYFPLGGNRVSKIKWFRNILVVWALTGLWHGASWNFIIWGLYFGLILLFEKVFLFQYLEKSKIISRIYTIVLVLISFVIFSVEDINSLFIFLKSMFGFNGLSFVNFDTMYYVKSFMILILISCLFSFPLFKKFEDKKLYKKIEPIVCLILFILITSYLVDSTFNPFLYFRF